MGCLHRTDHRDIVKPMQIKIDLTKNLTDLDGEPLKPASTAAKVLADALMKSSEGPAVKLLHIATALHRQGKVELAPDDYQTILGILERDRRLVNMGKGQIMLAMEEARSLAVAQNPTANK